MDGTGGAQTKDVFIVAQYSKFLINKSSVPRKDWSQNNLSIFSKHDNDTPKYTKIDFSKGSRPKYDH